MFYGIEMNVIDMPLHVDIATYRVLPKTPLPDRGIAMLSPRFGDRHVFVHRTAPA
jgi:hypothetical protein